jgi:N-acetylglutamate synthase-like GNAT family acetyltransferase
VNGYYTSTLNADMNVAAIHAFISETYWAKGVPLSTLKVGIENSVCCGVFTDDNTQAGFARMVTDRATFGYLADVYVLEEYRGIGLSRLLLQKLLAHPELQGLRRIMLATSDASGLYQKFGFEKLVKPEIFMELWDRYVYDDNKP